MKRLNISKKGVFIIAVTLLYNSLQCVQAVNLEHLKELKEKYIYVILYDEVEEIIKKVEKKEGKVAVEDYRIRVKKFNHLIESSLKTHWPNPDQLEFINFTNYLEILSTGFPENFAGVLVVYNNPAILMREVYWNTKGYVKKVKKLMVPYDWSFNNKENKIFMSPYEWSAATQKLTVSLSGICRFELWHKNGLRSSPRLDMRSGSPNEADFKIAALQTGSYLESQLDDNAPDLEKGFNQLSSKILLINELDLIDGMDTPDTLSKLYPFEYRIVSGPVMDSIILNHNIKYAALLLIPYPIIMKERTNQSDRSTTHNVGINLGYNTLALDLQDYRVLSQTKRTYKSDRIQALSLLALDPLTFKTKKKELLGMKGTVGMTSANEMALVGCALSGLLSVIALMYYFIF